MISQVRDGGKSGLSQEMLTIHGNNITQKDAESIYSLSIGSASTEAKLGRALSKTTYPIEISEIGQVESYGKNENLVEVLKTAVDGLITRRGRDMNNSNRYDTPFASCSPIIMNGNNFISRKGELIKRMHIATFSEEDRHDRNPKSDFNVFQTQHSHKYKILGDWTIRYILDNKNDLLLSGKYTVYEIAKIALTEFYHFVNREVPEWLTTWISDYALEELDQDDETIIRSILFELVNHSLERSSRLVELDNKVFKEYDDGKVYATGQIKPTSLQHRVLLCIENDLWSWFRKKSHRLGDNNIEMYYIDASILELFSKRLPNLDLKKLGEKMGFEYKQKKGGTRVLRCTKEQLVEFIVGKDLTEEEEAIK